MDSLKHDTPLKRIKKVLFKDINIADIDGKQRNSNINTQLLFSLVTKGVSLAVTFLQVPLLLKCLGNDAYGVWITIFSVVSWIAIADIGIGSGLRNKLATTLAKGQTEEGQGYISTAYMAVMAIAVGLSICAFAAIPFINWQSFFNIYQFTNKVLGLTVLIVVITTLFGFVLSLINQIFMAIQLNSYSAFPFLLANIAFITILYILSQFAAITVLMVAVVYSITFVVSFVVISFIFFKRYRHLRPKIKLYQKEKVAGIFKVGMGFFVIQFAGIIFFSTDNYIIARLFGPGEVSSYSITLKVFSSINMLFNLALGPLWSAYTEAYAKQDLAWIRSKINTFSLLMIPIAVVSLTIAYFFPLIVKLWLHNKPITVPVYLPYFMALFSIVSIWNNIYGYVLGGIGKVRLGAYSSIFMALLNIPLCFYFAVNLHMGILGIITATIVCIGISSILSPIQVYHFIYNSNRNKKWDKYLQ